MMRPATSTTTASGYAQGRRNGECENREVAGRAAWRGVGEDVRRRSGRLGEAAAQGRAGAERIGEDGGDARWKRGARGEETAKGSRRRWPSTKTHTKRNDDLRQRTSLIDTIRRIHVSTTMKSCSYAFRRLDGTIAPARPATQ